MRQIRWIAAAAVWLACSTAVGQCVGYACRPAPARRTVVSPAWTWVRPRPAYATPQAIAATPVAIATHPADDAATFLARLNAWRARHGRHAVGWDATLAAYAASNSWAGHQPGSSGGAAQCWASHRSLVAALDAWVASPAHASILLNASVAVGASPCPSGSTCNAR